jgi:DNA-binding transcriptional MerR regulator
LVTDESRPIFSIGAVARMLELPPATMRTWETRYALVVPHRSPGGQRLYTREQVEQLRFVKKTVAGGSRPGQAHRLLAERLAEAPAAGAPKIRVVLEPSALAGILLRQLLERDGFVIAEDAELVVVSVQDERGAELSGRLQREGHRVLALVDEHAVEPSADAILRLPIATRELIEAARRLAAS